MKYAKTTSKLGLSGVNHRKLCFKWVFKVVFRFNPLGCFENENLHKAARTHKKLVLGF